MNKKAVKMVKLGKEKPDMVFNKVWEVTQMTWPEPTPEKIDRTKVRLTYAG